jgi:exodeoxyribonuclease V alpha subunit
MNEAKAPEHGDTIQGTIQRVVYRSADTGYVVLEVSVAGGQRVAALGTMANPVPGETVRLWGRWEVHSRWGRQFRFDEYELLRQATGDGLALYLAESVQGIGPELARRIVEHFGDKTVEALEAGAERLREVPGIGEKKAAALAAAWQAHRHVHDLMIFLRSRGLSPSLASRVYRAYGSRAIEVIENQPYRLAREMRGVGFLTADRIAMQTGVPAEDPERIQAGLLHVLSEGLGDGHLYLPRDVLTERAAKLLKVPADLVAQQLQQMVKEGDIYAEADSGGEEACYRPDLLSCEKHVAWLLRELASGQPLRAPQSAQAHEWLRRFEAFSGLELNEDQRRGVMATTQWPVCVLTGGPGTGKTTVVNAITWVWHHTGRRVALCAPTGRAAKRLEEVTGREAFTIHRLLGYRPDGGFSHGPATPLPYDLVVVDEASMVDMPLAQSLLSAIGPGAVLVLVGDADQLPPVGPGAFYGEVVASGALATTRLTQVYRQAERSLIVMNAHRLLRNEPLVLPRPARWHGEDMLWVDVEQQKVEEATEDIASEASHSTVMQQVALHKITQAVTRNLPRAGFAPEDIQVLSPMRRGILGVDNLNQHLQRLLNSPSPDKPELRRGETVFRLGDRVLQTANNYDKGVFNGEIGQIAEVDAEGRLVVDFAVGRIEYERGDTDQLELAYALTVHKSQGSEYPAVVLAVHSSHYIMLRRNLLYTALTRAQRMAILIGDRRGLWKAVRTAPARERLTRLAKRLRGELPADPSDLTALPGLALDQ